MEITSISSKTMLQKIINKIKDKYQPKYNVFEIIEEAQYSETIYPIEIPIDIPTNIAKELCEKWWNSFNKLGDFHTLRIYKKTTRHTSQTGLDTETQNPKILKNKKLCTSRTMPTNKITIAKKNKYV
jgi:hypothetical protein